MGEFTFRYPVWREIEPNDWVTKWAALYGEDESDNSKDDALIEKDGMLSSKDFECIGRWKEGCPESIFQSKDEHENRTGNEEAAQRPTSFLWFLVFRERTVVMVASGRGKVGNLLLVFHFSMDAKPGGGNVGISRFLRDFQGTVESVGNPLLVFHAFHGPGISTALR